MKHDRQCPKCRGRNVGYSVMADFYSTSLMFGETRVASERWLCTRRDLRNGSGARLVDRPRCLLRCAEGRTFPLALRPDGEQLEELIHYFERRDD